MPREGELKINTYARVLQMEKQFSIEYKFHVKIKEYKEQNGKSEKLSFGGQEMSGNVGKYGETQAQICPYSQQTLKV